MLLENGIVRVGAEIEVVAFQPGVTYQSVAKKLLEMGHMEGQAKDWKKWHDYKCSCSTGCGRVKSGAVLQPLLVSIQYDASLPDTGAEFIVSPALLLNGLEEMRDVYETICDQAVWDNELPSRRGAPSSPSIHLHVSALNPPQDRNMKTDEFLRGDNPLDHEDVLQALTLFAPELFLVTDMPDIRRGLTFRQPWRHTQGRQRHHGWIHVRAHTPLHYLHIEWRLFEAAYSDWEYFEGTAYLAGALTRALLRPNVFEAMMAAGYSNPPPNELVNKAIASDNTEMFLKLADPLRLAFLAEMLDDALTDDPYGFGLVGNMLERAFTRV